ncbi:MAG: hypothetical protein AABX74_05240 [Nanoarchaeota archaeon]
MPMNKKIIFEVMPYPKAASESYADKITDKIVDAVNAMENVSIINIPEIVEENHIGQPYYRNTDPRVFGKVLGEKCSKEIMVNTVVVHHKSKVAFERWLDESIGKYGVKNFVFVGAKIPSIRYPGPSVTEANSIANKKGVNFGNIFIPDRPEEAERLLSKTRSGCNFFTSQVLFDPDTAINVIKQYLKKCEISNLKPAKFYLSLAPVGNEEDVIFIKWLGAEINEDTEKRLLDSKNMGEESVELLLELIGKIKDFSNYNKKVEIGLNIEYIMLHNLDLAKNLVTRASDLLD